MSRNRFSFCQASQPKVNYTKQLTDGHNIMSYAFIN